MSVQNGSYDQASIPQAIAALLLGEAIHIRCKDRAERERLRARFRRYATRLGFEAEIRAEEPFLIVRWNKVATDYQI